MKKYLKITLLVVIAIILVGTFVFLYQKSKPKVITYETVRPVSYTHLTLPTKA